MHCPVFGRGWQYPCVSDDHSDGNAGNTLTKLVCEEKGSTFSSSTMKQYVQFGFGRKTPPKMLVTLEIPSSAVSWKGSEKDTEKSLVSGDKGRRILYEPLSAREAELGMPMPLVMLHTSTDADE